VQPFFNPAVQNAAFLCNPGAHLAQRRKMKVNRPWAKIAAARGTEHRPTVLCRHRTEKNNGRPHFTHQLLRNRSSLGMCRINPDQLPIALRITSQLTQNLRRQPNIGKCGAILQHALSRCEQRRSKNRQHAVFCSKNPHGAFQMISSANDELSHSDTHPSAQKLNTALISPSYAFVRQVVKTFIGVQFSESPEKSGH